MLRPVARNHIQFVIFWEQNLGEKNRKDDFSGKEVRVEKLNSRIETNKPRA